MKKIIVSLLCFITFLGQAETAGAVISDCIALYGESKYKSGFKHFDYVNAKAPQGGRLVLPAYGTFDNFNPYIFKGVAATFVASLSFETLGFSPADDPAITSSSSWTACGITPPKSATSSNTCGPCFLMRPAPSTATMRPLWRTIWRSPIGAVHPTPDRKERHPMRTTYLRRLVVPP